VRKEVAVATVRLPDQPSFDQLRNLARDLQRAVRAGDAAAIAHAAEHSAPGEPATFRLAAAQLVIARHYGFPSWARLKRHLETLAEYTRVPDEVGATDDLADEFIRLACLNYGDDNVERRLGARRLLAEHPDVARSTIFTAAANADADEVRRRLAADPSLAHAQGGPFRWTALFHLAYARHDPDVSAEATLATARALLDHGADPNAGYLWHGLPTPFTVLTGVFGSGEQGPVAQPRHPHAPALARLLLEAGADANDGQALYNRMFRPDNDHIELLFEFGLGSGDGGVWKRRLGPALESPAEMLASQLWWAAVHDMRERVRVLVEHGTDVNARWRDGRSMIEWAAASGNVAVVEYLRNHGAVLTELAPVDALVAAAMAVDRDAVERLRRAHPDVVDQARAQRPALMVSAAAAGRLEAVRLLADLGFDVNALGRGDAPAPGKWETALHQAASEGDVALATLLLERGADPNIHDARFDATPLGWAHHFEQPALIALLEPVTTE
jgi:hypothetical protein